jgi:deoxyadenosine/deoxycytidine kinase
MHIAIAGNIGSGKTTLTELLAARFQWQPHYEDLADNPYLYSFYEDMQRWAFHLQVFFLSKRFRQIMDIQRSAAAVIQDRTVFEDAHVFAANLHDMGLMSGADFGTYTAIYDLLNGLVSPPDLLIYLRASVDTLLTQIKLRGREYETGISPAYLSRLNTKYEAWFDGYSHRKIMVNVDQCNFVENPSMLAQVAAQVQQALQNIKTSSHAARPLPHP